MYLVYKFFFCNNSSTNELKADSLAIIKAQASLAFIGNASSSFVIPSFVILTNVSFDLGPNKTKEILPRSSAISTIVS